MSIIRNYEFAKIVLVACGATRGPTGGRGEAAQASFIPCKWFLARFGAVECTVQQ